MSAVTVLSETPTCKHLKTNAITPTNSIKSMDSIYSATSKFSALSRRKGIQKNRTPSIALIPAVSEIKQRVTSARMLRMKQLQNQIGEAQHRISELAAENRLLKSLHKRQDSALSKYESSSAELPQLLNSHAEELRMWQTRCRNLQRLNKELAMKVKQKDTLILTLTDQNKQLTTLNKDKSLLERANLQERVKDLELRLVDKESEMKLLTRRLQLESKSYKSNLQMEQQKYRDLLMKIEMSDFLLNRDNKKQSTMKPAAKLIRNLSPNRLTSKSATTLSSVAINEPNDRIATTVLPPCDGDGDNSNDSHLMIKKAPETVKNNSPSVNGHAEALQNEINLTKNIVDRSEKMPAINNNNNDEEDVTCIVKNGMNRARKQQQQKLAPIINAPSNDNNNKINNGDKKSSDDSEFSNDDDDDEEEINFLRNHNNGTMAKSSSSLHQNNNKDSNIIINNKKNLAKDLLDHKLHINQLENQMIRNSPSHPPSATSDISSISQQSTLCNTIINYSPSEIMSIRHHDNHRESMLDDLCDSLTDTSSYYSAKTASTFTRVKKLEFNGGGSQTPTNNNNSIAYSNSNSYETNDGNNHIKSNGVSLFASANNNINVNGRLDDKKKSKLLAALKHIDNGSSFEN